MALDQAHKDRKAELEKQIADGSTDENAKTELEAINKLDAENSSEGTVETTSQADPGATPNQKPQGVNPQGVGQVKGSGAK